MTDSREFQFAPHWHLVSFFVTAIGIVLVVHHLSAERYFYVVVWAVVAFFTLLQGIKTKTTPALTLRDNHVELYRTPLIPPLSIAFSTIEEVSCAANALRIRMNTGRKYRWSMLWLKKDERDLVLKLVDEGWKKNRSEAEGV